MKAFTVAAVFAASTFTAGAALAGPIDNACMRSDRASASRSLCGCIQNVANAMLTAQDQRLAAKFFTKPDMAQEVRMSKSAYHNEFWGRYKSFGAKAAASCS
nr:hypothetical protein [Oceanicola sp. 22II-s10i]